MRKIESISKSLMYITSLLYALRGVRRKPFLPTQIS